MDFKEEKFLLNSGFRFIVGLDEAGRGALAGPLVAGAVLFDKRLLTKNGKKLFNFYSKIKDSKQLTPKQRQEVFDFITNNFIWSIGQAKPREVDKLGIVSANKLAMRRAVENLEIKPDYLLIDYIKDIGLELPTKGIVKGDNKVFSIAAASIVAKVSRDCLMEKYHKRYNKWHFDVHKGYGTSLHMSLIKEYGASSLHRKSFSPVSKILQYK